jgi:hypothetical protein
MSSPCKIDLRGSIVKLIDADSVELEIKIDEGNVQFTKQRNIEVQLNQGRIDYFKEGDETLYDVQIECRFSCIKSSNGDPVTTYEFLTGTGNGSTINHYDACNEATSIGATIVSDLLTADPSLHWTIFTDFCYTKIDGNFKDGVLSITGVAKGLFADVV